MDNETPGKSSWQVVVGAITTLCALLYCILDQFSDRILKVLIEPVSHWLSCKIWVAVLVSVAVLALISTACIVIYSMLNKHDVTPKN